MAESLFGAGEPSFRNLPVTSNLQSVDRPDVECPSTPLKRHAAQKALCSDKIACEINEVTAPFDRLETRGASTVGTFKGPTAAPAGLDAAAFTASTACGVGATAWIHLGWYFADGTAPLLPRPARGERVGVRGPIHD